EVGILMVPSAYNGADLITAQILRLLHGRVETYIALNAGLWAFFLGLVLYLRRRYAVDLRLFFPVLIESAIYAFTMGSLICFMMVDLLHVDPRLTIAVPLSSAGQGTP